VVAVNVATDATEWRVVVRTVVDQHADTLRVVILCDGAAYPTPSQAREIAAALLAAADEVEADVLPEGAS
jgi:uncharacterized heparinase superfamily protein